MSTSTTTIPVGSLNLYLVLFRWRDQRTIADRWKRGTNDRCFYADDQGSHGDNINLAYLVLCCCWSCYLFHGQAANTLQWLFIGSPAAPLITRPPSISRLCCAVPYLYTRQLICMPSYTYSILFHSTLGLSQSHIQSPCGSSQSSSRTWPGRSRRGGKRRLSQKWN